MAVDWSALSYSELRYEGVRFRCGWRVGDRKDLKMKREMKNGMIGAIVGDIAGARFEWHNRKCMG